MNPVYYVFPALGLPFVPLAGSVLFNSDVCGCEPPMGVAVSMIVVALGTIAWWLSVLLSATPKWLGRASAVVGYLGTAGMLVFGLIRAISDAAEIIN